MRFWILALALLVLPAAAGAQEAKTSPAPVATEMIAPPTIAADAQLRLQVFELRAENISLKVAALQAEFAKLQNDAGVFAQSLKRDGFTLQRGQDGAWGYAPTAPAAKEPK